LAAIAGLRDLLDTAGSLAAEQGGTLRLTARILEIPEINANPANVLTALILPPSLSRTRPGPLPPALARWIKLRYSEGTLLCSVCAGAFLLADLGILDGRRVTTHWALSEEFAARYPRVCLDTDRLLIDDGDLITAGGLMAWTDLGLRLVSRYLGPVATIATARFFLIDPGGREQRFYRIFTPLRTHGDEAILRVQRWLQANIGETSTTVDRMAAEAGLGRRTFLRRFQAATGFRTSEYIQQLRVGSARELLELSTKSLQEVAWEVGYEDPGALRKVFARWMGLSPGEYRRRFACGPATAALTSSTR
jgi:transcriptional regulator GlxA family with amidase domain